MNRKEFIAAGCLSCFSGGVILSVLESCSATKIITASIAGSDLIVPLTDFEKGNQKFKKYLVVQNELLKYPVCVFRFDENYYEAVLMKCTHQGTVLQVSGDMLHCPAHGSEFDDHGKVVSGPANTPLRTFRATVVANQLKISLK